MHVFVEQMDVFVECDVRKKWKCFLYKHIHLLYKHIHFFRTTLLRACRRQCVSIQFLISFFFSFPGSTFASTRGQSILIHLFCVRGFSFMFLCLYGRRHPQVLRALFVGGYIYIYIYINISIYIYINIYTLPLFVGGLLS